jgi:exopolysaccharide biosynthesis WecB/TagA/CpsF family protein
MKHRFFNLHLDVLSREEVFATCEHFLASKHCHTLCFLNAHCFNVAQDEPEYASALTQASLVLNDGIGIKLMSLLARVPIRENLNGTDLIPELLIVAAAAGAPVYLLGGKAGVAERAADALIQRIPGLRIAGCHSGFFTAAEETALVASISRSGARMLVVGMGVPRQELWSDRHRTNLHNVQLIVSGGAILDFLSGAVPRAPTWMRQLRLEWLFRLWLEPRRMWRRYILGSVLLLGHVLRLSLPSRPTWKK